MKGAQKPSKRSEQAQRGMSGARPGRRSVLQPALTPPNSGAGPRSGHHPTARMETMGLQEKPLEDGEEGTATGQVTEESR